MRAVYRPGHPALWSAPSHLDGRSPLAVGATPPSKSCHRSPLWDFDAFPITVECIEVAEPTSMARRTSMPAADDHQAGGIEIVPSKSALGLRCGPRHYPEHRSRRADFDGTLDGFPGARSLSLAAPS